MNYIIDIEVFTSHVFSSVQLPMVTYHRIDKDMMDDLRVLFMG